MNGDPKDNHGTEKDQDVIGQASNLTQFPKPIDLVEMRHLVEERKKIGEEKFGKRNSAGGDEISSDFVRECLWSNQLGDGELYKALHQGKFIFCKSMKTWLAWTGHHWKIDHMNQAESAVENVALIYLKEAWQMKKQLSETDKETRKALEKIIDSLENRANKLRSDFRRQACLKFAHTTASPLAIMGDELDGNPWLLGCKNGVVNLKTGEFRDGRPDDWILKASPVEWKGLDAQKNVWVQAVTDIMEGDENIVAFLQRLFGMAIVGKVVEKAFPVLTGPGGDNGKTTIIEAISNALGPMAGPIPSDMLVAGLRSSSSGPSPDIMSLKGLRIAYASETEDGAKVSAARVKLMTGKDSLTGRWPNDKFPITFEPTHTLFLLSNFKPRADSQDKAFWSRIINIPFNMRFLKNREPESENERPADPYLDEKLKEQASGILAWIVEGCLKWQKQGLEIPLKVHKEGEDYQSGEDDMGAFVDYCCLVGSERDYESGASELYDVFFKWWKRYVGNYPPKQKRLGTYLRGRFRYEKVGGIYKYFGIGINPEVVEELDLYTKK